ncbi:MAG: LacI family DNA-binding transcriptional regulator [Lawsonibacter sp.]
MTIKDIARLSGCGVATVSRVLNHHLDVSEEKRRRVMEVVEEHGFELNRNAKHLKQQAGTSIAILVKGTQNMLFAEIVEQVQALLRDSGRDAAVYYLDEEANEVAYACQLCRERKPLGILFLGGDRACFQTRFGSIAVPCVLLTNTAQDLGFDNLSSLTTDDEGAAARVIDYLAERGHRSIGVLGGNAETSQISALRLRGCREAFRRRGLPFEPDDQWVCCRYSMADAYEATGRLLSRSPDLTAIFAMSDVMAIGAIRLLADRGKAVPEDISVVGYDGISLAGYCVPRLTTVKQDAGRLARQGVELLLARLEHPAGPVHERIPFQLVEGESVARRLP